MSRPAFRLALVGLLVPPLVMARGGQGDPHPRSYPDSPPPAHTGGFGEPTCHECHWGSDVNEPRGSIELEGLPARAFEPGATYQLTVRLQHPELRRAGLQLSARFAEGAEHGENAGTFAAGEGTTVVSAGDAPPIEYLQQTLEGAEVEEPGSAVWTFHWHAPSDAADPVVFHLAANAANDDLSEVGDFVYVLERTLGVPEGSGGRGRDAMR